MTRKHYKAIASALHGGMSTTRDKDDDQWLSDRIILACAERIADVMAADNPRFDRRRFMAAVEGA